MLDANRARSAADFDAAISNWPGATFNFVFADREGAVGFRLAGSIPRRGRGEGLLPQSGPESPGPPPPLAPEEVPHLLIPQDGVVVSANQAPGGDLELGEEWCEPIRASRISELLRSRSDHSVASFQQVQLDLDNAELRRLRDLVLARAVVDDEAASAILEGWDGQSDAASPGAAIMQTVYQELARALVSRVGGPATDLVLGSGLNAPVGQESRFHYRLQGRLVGALVDAAAPWLDDEADRDRVLRSAVERSLALLRDRLGSDLAAWRWGDLHRQPMPHPLAAIPALGKRFSIPARAWPGDVNTVWQGGYTVHAGPDATGGFTPVYRQVIDLGRWDRSSFQLPAGNSGIPGDPHYDDCVEEFFEGRQRPLLYSREAINRNAEATLDLVPASANP